MGFIAGDRRPVGGGTIESRVKALEAWKSLASTLLTNLGNRVTALEARPAGTDYSKQIKALTARLDAVEAKVCPQESRIQALEQKP
jgi:uncharacterized coiled-coil protein SlyX